MITAFNNLSLDDMPDELWRDVNGYKGIYNISNYGRIKSLKRIDCKGQHRKERILKQSLDSDRYPLITLSKERIRRTLKPHRLVAFAFIENALGLTDVNHKDGNKLNNHVSNLEWCTNKENVAHAVEMGLKKTMKGTHNKGCILSEKQVLYIFCSHKTNMELSKEFRVSPLAINRIRIGKTWGHLTGKEYIQKYPSFPLRQK